MFCEIKNYVDVESKRGFSASDALQFVLTLYLFLGSLIIKIFYLGCGGWQWKLWIDFVFFGSLLWLAFLFVTSIGRYKNPNVQHFFTILEWLYFAFLLGLWVWLIVIFALKQFLGCSDPVDMFGIILLVLGALAAIVAIFGIVGGLWTLIRPSDSSNRAAFYNDDVDFNPYQ